MSGDPYDSGERGQFNLRCTLVSFEIAFWSVVALALAMLLGPLGLGALSV
jgi:hypothetical protein